MTTENGFSVQGIAEKVSACLNPSALQHETFYVPVSGSPVLESLAEEIFFSIDNIYGITRKIPFTKDDLVKAFRKALEARILQVSGVKMDVQPKLYCYPSILGPVLEMVGKYRNTTKGYTIIPSLCEHKEEEGHEALVRKSRAVLVDMPFFEFERIMNQLESFGVYIARCLPQSVTVDTPDLYMLEIADDVLTGTEGNLPNPMVMYARIMVQMTYLSVLFGQGRVVYTAISSLRNAVRNSVNASFDLKAMRS